MLYSPGWPQTYNSPASASRAAEVTDHPWPWMLLIDNFNFIFKGNSNNFVLNISSDFENKKRRGGTELQTLQKLFVKTMISVKHNYINSNIYSTCTHETILGFDLICLMVVLFIKGNNFNNNNLIISRTYTFCTQITLWVKVWYEAPETSLWNNKPQFTEPTESQSFDSNCTNTLNPKEPSTPLQLMHLHIEMVEGAWATPTL